MITEDIYVTQNIELPIVTVLRLNVDALGYLSNAQSEESTLPTILQLMENHSAYIIELSEKISKSQRVDLKAVK
jgi:hypothetical protein